MTGSDIYFSSSHGKIYAGWKIPASAQLSSTLVDALRDVLDHEMNMTMNTIPKHKADLPPILSDDDEIPAGLNAFELGAIKHTRTITLSPVIIQSPRTTERERGRKRKKGNCFFYGIQ
jgi:hypothetical protein